MEFIHIPVLATEVIEGLDIKNKKIIVDGTVGGGGHSELILMQNKDIHIIAFDRDNEAIASAKTRLEKYKDRITFVHQNFKSIADYLLNNKISVDGVLLDLGVSSYQLDNADRGFSFRFDSKLDMRMDTEQNFTAEDVVNKYSEQKLADIFFKFGELKFSYKIAKNIIKHRPINSTQDLKNIIEKAVPLKSPIDKLAAVQKAFQAIRIEVNDELNGIEDLLIKLPKVMNSKARICVISFHSLEDRIIKNAFSLLSKDCICPPQIPKCVCNHRSVGQIINKKPIVATNDEVVNNSRSSCAKLRIFEVI